LSQAGNIGRTLAGLGLSPSLVLCSDAKRAIETYDLAKAAFRGTPKVEYKSELYNASAEAIYDLVAKTPDNVDTVMIVGHNPGFSEVVSWLSAAQYNLGTAHAAVLNCESETWAGAIQMTNGNWNLRGIVRPTKPEEHRH